MAYCIASCTLWTYIPLIASTCRMQTLFTWFMGTDRLPACNNYDVSAFVMRELAHECCVDDE